MSPEQHPAGVRKASDVSRNGAAEQSPLELVLVTVVIRLVVLDIHSHRVDVVAPDLRSERETPDRSGRTTSRPSACPQWRWQPRKDSHTRRRRLPWPSGSSVATRLLYFLREETASSRAQHAAVDQIGKMDLLAKPRLRSGEKPDLWPGGTGQIWMMASVSSFVRRRMASSVHLSPAFFRSSRLRNRTSCPSSPSRLPPLPSHGPFDTFEFSLPVSKRQIAERVDMAVALGLVIAVAAASA